MNANRKRERIVGAVALGVGAGHRARAVGEVPEAPGDLDAEPL